MCVCGCVEQKARVRDIEAAAEQLRSEVAAQALALAAASGERDAARSAAREAADRANVRPLGPPTPSPCTYIHTQTHEHRRPGLYQPTSLERHASWLSAKELYNEIELQSDGFVSTDP